VNGNSPLSIIIKLNSRVDLANLVHAACDEVCRLAHMDEDSALNLGIALREATLNAMKHGNNLVEDKDVEVKFELKKDRLEVTISDEGAGFDHSSGADPRQPENLTKFNGRGLFLMEKLTDGVDFHCTPEKGTTVRLMKKLSRNTRRKARG
jgi:serine/threonine-protein kinase RsbW